MVNVLVTLAMIALFFLSGRIYESIKRLLMLLIDSFLKLLNLFGIQVTKKEQHLKISKEFKDTFKDVKIVKKSKENIKLKPSINIVALVVLILSIVLVIVNLDSVSGGVITNWLYSLKIIQKLVHSEQSLDVIFVAIAFSLISFSISKLISQWKETKKYRQVKKEMALKNKALNLMSSKDLLTAAKLKDEKNLLEIIKDKEDKE